MSSKWNAPGIKRGAALAAGMMVGTAALAAPAPANEPIAAQPQTSSYALAAFTSPRPSTVITLEGGIVGLQTLVRFTPLQLQGDLCKRPNVCTPADYPALPSDVNNALGTDSVEVVLDSLSPDQPVILFGHSQGGQVIYDALRRWQNDPEAAPDPSRVSWVSIGNPENPYGGVTSKFGFAQPNPRVPADTPYKGTEVIYQYDGWADAPDNPLNLLAVLNAVIGSQIYHTTKYFTVDVNDPSNVRFTPDQPDGTPGNITYVYVPADVIPLVSGTGLLAPVLDKLLRPIIEQGYNRPVKLPDPNAPKAASSVMADVPVVQAAAAVAAPVEVANPEAADAPVVRDDVKVDPADVAPAGDPAPESPVVMARSAVPPTDVPAVPVGVEPASDPVQDPVAVDVPKAASATAPVAVDVPKAASATAPVAVDVPKAASAAPDPVTVDVPKVDTPDAEAPRSHRGLSSSRTRTSHSHGGAE